MLSMWNAPSAPVSAVWFPPVAWLSAINSTRAFFIGSPPGSLVTIPATVATARSCIVWAEAEKFSVVVVWPRRGEDAIGSRRLGREKADTLLLVTIDGEVGCEK